MYYWTMEQMSQPNVPDSVYGDASSAAKTLWRHDKGSLAKFMKLLELKGWKDGKSGSDEDGPQV